MTLALSDRFTYEYNFFDNWLHDIRIENVLKLKNLILFGRKW
ncbi:plasmid pRiA4b ORF-3 family protein [Photorhabdus khanii]|nr:plasmid pRiA4b ORF-3 family protein [Photorhabdus khanii]